MLMACAMIENSPNRIPGGTFHTNQNDQTCFHTSTWYYAKTTKLLHFGSLGILRMAFRHWTCEEEQPIHNVFQQCNTSSQKIQTRYLRGLEHETVEIENCAEVIIV